MQPVKCLFCNSAAIEASHQLPIYFNDKTITWNRCNNCNLVFLQPALTEQDKEKMYNRSYHQQFYFTYTEDYSKQLKVIAPYKKRTFLDYGCGDGGLMSFLHTHQFNVTGVEYDKNLVAELASKFAALHFIEQRTFWQNTETYDIIHLGDVLEHVSDPATLISELKKKLSPDGLFFIEGPLECNPNLAYYFRKCTYWLKRTVDKEAVRVKVPYHITYSNAKNQQLFFNTLQLQQISFKITEAGWPYIDTITEIKSPWLFIQYLVAKISIMVSGIIPWFGNRFIYMGKPKNN